MCLIAKGYHRHAEMKKISFAFEFKVQENRFLWNSVLPGL